jgi:ribulose 1,5-bisphosphate synthetase/thiazole synthase
MNLTQRHIDILESVLPTVISAETILDGTGNKRPLVQKYTATDFEITETRFYKHLGDSPAWAESTSTYTVKEVSNGY